MGEVTNEMIGRRIADARLRSELTQAELAAAPADRAAAVHRAG
jgi:hypothetical protein